MNIKGINFRNCLKIARCCQKYHMWETLKRSYNISLAKSRNRQKLLCFLILPYGITDFQIYEKKGIKMSLIITLNSLLFKYLLKIPTNLLGKVSNNCRCTRHALWPDACSLNSDFPQVVKYKLFPSKGHTWISAACTELCTDIVILL